MSKQLQQQASQPIGTDNVIRIPPQQYIHVLDQNNNLTRLEIGPMTFVKKQNEKVLMNPTAMIQLQIRTYCKIADPIILKDKKPVMTSFGQVKNRFGEFEIRTAEQYSDPFPLYPGERLVGNVEKQMTILQNTELKIQATRDFFDGKQQRVAGEEWQIPGPFTYTPKVEEVIVEVVKAQIIKPNQALVLKAKRNLKDSEGVERKVGEEWIIRTTGSYVPQVYEQVIKTINGKVLTDQISLHLKAIKTFKDVYGVMRQAGEEWLITNAQTQVHINDIFEELVREEKLITLSSRDYCVIINPIDKKTKKNIWGSRELRKGETSFFLQPGEELLNNKVQQVNVLGEDEALLLLALQGFKDDEGKQRKTGERWMILGPREYIPPIEVEILEKRKAIPLDQNEGIYIRNQDTGEVRSFTGQTYLLQAHESLWEKELSTEVEELLAATQVEIKKQKSSHGTERIDKQRVITYKAPHNSAVQLYNYKTKKCRVVFGPNQILLEPYENFTVLNLSGGCPVQEKFQKLLALNLGPDFMQDKIVVETSDHAQLSLQLAYNWRFKVDQTNQDECLKIFSIPDFVGFVCQTIASRIRGAVSSVTFEDFHHNSSRYIQESVFGKDAQNNIRPEIFFLENNLQVTSVDIQNVSITDEETRENLEKCLNLAIEIKAQSQEADSKHKAQKLDQESKGQLEQDNLEFQIKKEEAKINLLKMEAQSKEVQMIGEAKAKAQASAQSELITIEAEVKQAEIRAKQMEIESSAEIEQIRANQNAELENKKGQMELEIKKMQELSEIEVKKFQQIVKAIGKDTLVAISKAGPEQRGKLLQGLGLKGYLITDGKNPINLFNTASGFMGDQVQK